MKGNVKETPKSCSCRMCRFAKASEYGHFFLKAAERRFRHSAKVAMRTQEEFDIAPRTDRVG